MNNKCISGDPVQADRCHPVHLRLLLLLLDPPDRHGPLPLHSQAHGETDIGQTGNKPILTGHTKSKKKTMQGKEITTPR